MKEEGRRKKEEGRRKKEEALYTWIGSQLKTKDPNQTWGIKKFIRG
ncbi:MAG: hypothetical protein KME60_02855 [Cyanomargarita calcarea GSE-NOS-MK-12-04C]|uniref:Uncharacterized protein n=1 Tax=Cyanomargarita calcarea GSE-NOS-MK-12-04C TaxID=2839659 RepID=A0A951QK01_9CYAN|nr:hypothetical protein [Cyanomargarita calcarea GSE-NOS-MK-12-04C]